jgi:dipeptide transport system substrate-binding protein
MFLKIDQPKMMLRAAVAFVALAAAGAHSPSTIAGSPPQKLVFCSEGSPEFFGPSISTTGTSLDANIPIYDTLVRHIRGSTRLAPGLAERWEVSRDGTEYTFFLQRGVRWHRNALFEPTREFNADDVLFVINRQWKTNDPYHRVNSSQHAFFNSLGLGSFIKRADKLDDHTIKFTLHEPKAAFLSMFALPFMGVQSYEYAVSLMRRGMPELLDQQPIGTGPFYWVGYEPDQRIRYRAFADHWRGRAKLDELEFLITPSAEERWQRLQRNECQLMPFPNPADLPRMRAHPNVTVFQQPGLNVGYLAYNTAKPPFNDVRVRKAFNMAINKAALVEQVFKGTGTPAVSLIPPTMWSHNSHLKDEPYNPIEAKRLLAEAGFANGMGIDFWVMPVTRGYNPNPELMGQLIAQDLSRVGVQVNIKTDEWRNYYRRMTQGEHSMGLLGWTGSHGDPDYFFYNLLSCEAAQEGGANVAKFCNAAYDDLVMRARTMANPALRIPLYEEAQRIFKAQAPWLPIAHSVQTVVYRNEVVNFRASPFGLHDFYGVEMEPLKVQRP